MTAEHAKSPSAQRYAVCVEYDGALFSGWQRQPGTRTVQEAVERALSFVADHPVNVVCAGRTDAGVHAVGQVVHFDSGAKRSQYNWLRGANTRLPEGIALNWVQPVTGDFHARFKARRRHYRYVLVLQSVKPALLRHRATWEHRALDHERMTHAAEALLGRHDFSAFRASSCQSRDPVKTVYRIDINRDGRFVWLDLEADGFLHHMVRNITGVLTTIGCGEREPVWCAEVLESRDRRLGGITASAEGLYLTRVDYDACFELPPPPPAPRFW